MKKKNLNFERLLDNKKFVLILSVIIAVLAWFIIAIFVDPQSSATIKGIPLTFSDSKIDQPLSVISGGDQTINIKVEGKRYRIGTLTASDFVVTPEISSIVDAGEYTVKLTVQKSNPTDEDFTIVSSPENIKLTFDHISEKTFELEATAENVVAKDGYVKETPTVSPNKVTLSGAKTEIDNIAKCVVRYDGNDLVSENLVAKGKLIVYDINGNTIEPQHVSGLSGAFTITIPIYKQKTVKLVPSFNNVPDGITISNYYTLSEETINIRGPEAIINNIDSVPLNPIIDFRNFDIGSVHNLEVSLPSTAIISTDNVKNVTLSVKATGLSSTKLNVTNIFKRNVPADYSVNIVTSTIQNVKLVGQSDDIEKLSSKDLIAYIDFQENKSLTEGTQSCVVTIYCTGNKHVWAVGTYSAVITAKKS